MQTEHVRSTESLTFCCLFVACVLCRAHDVCDSVQHGTDWLAIGKDWHRADGLELRAAVYASHDSSVTKSLGCAG